MSFIQFIESNYQTKLAKQGEELLVCCPFCDDENFHAAINVEKGLFHCFRCDATGGLGKGLNARQFLRHAHGMSTRQINEIIESEQRFIPNRNDLAERLQTQIFQTDIEEAEPLKLPDNIRPVSKSDRSVLGRKASRYLYGRVVKLPANYEVYYTAFGKYAGRMIFPVTYRDELVYFQARSFYPVSRRPKYMNPAVDNVPLAGLDYAQREDALILVEGIFDWLSVGPGSSALLGSTINDRQLNMLAHHRPEQIILALDPDDTGQQATTVIAKKILKTFSTQIFTVKLPKDPSDLGKKAKKICIKNAVPFKPLENQQLRDAKKFAENAFFP